MLLLWRRFVCPSGPRGSVGDPTGAGWSWVGGRTKSNSCDPNERKTKRTVGLLGPTLEPGLVRVPDGEHLVASPVELSWAQPGPETWANQFPVPGFLVSLVGCSRGRHLMMSLCWKFVC